MPTNEDSSVLAPLDVRGTVEVSNALTADDLSRILGTDGNGVSVPVTIDEQSLSAMQALGGPVQTVSVDGEQVQEMADLVSSTAWDWASTGYSALATLQFEGFVLIALLTLSCGLQFAHIMSQRWFR